MIRSDSGEGKRMPEKMPDGWKLAKTFDRYLINVWEDTQTRKWNYSLAPKPERDVYVSSADPGEHVVGGFKSKCDAVKAAEKEIVRRNLQRKGGEKR